jgi:hypothetical protein
MTVPAHWDCPYQQQICVLTKGLVVVLQMGTLQGVALVCITSARWDNCKDAWGNMLRPVSWLPQTQHTQQTPHLSWALVDIWSNQQS